MSMIRLRPPFGHSLLYLDHHRSVPATLTIVTIYYLLYCYPSTATLLVRIFQYYADRARLDISAALEVAALRMSETVRQRRCL